MTSTRLVRGTKSRMFVYVCALILLGGVAYVYHGTQSRLEEVKKSATSCVQQQESLSAQLQVIFEYKLRLENSLQKEKQAHRETKEECANQAQEQKEHRSKEGLEAANKYNAVSQHYKLLQSQHNDLKDDCSKIRKAQLEGLEEKSKLQSMVQALRQELKQTHLTNQNALEAMKTHYLDLKQDHQRLTLENKKMGENIVPNSSRANTLQKQVFQLERELSDAKAVISKCGGGLLPEEESKKVSKSAVNNDNLVAPDMPKFMTNNSTTPGINPDALSEHDPSQKPGISKESKLSSAPGFQLTSKHATQEAAAPLQPPDEQIKRSHFQHLMDAAAVHSGVVAPAEHFLRPPKATNEENVGLKPDDLRNSIEGQVPGPIPQYAERLLVPPGGKRQAEYLNGRDINGAVEQDDPEDGVGPAPNNHHPAPAHYHLDNKEGAEIPRNMNNHYQGGDYDKEQQEDEDDPEGEQLDRDYVQKEDSLKREHVKLPVLKPVVAGVL